jgi:hypothetical protein
MRSEYAGIGRNAGKLQIANKIVGFFSDFLVNGWGYNESVGVKLFSGA